MEQSTVIIVDDEADLRHALAQSLQLLGNYKTLAFETPEEAIGAIHPDLNGVLVSDVRMPRTDGLALMAAVLEVDLTFPVILMTGHGDVPMAVEAMRNGAYDFIEKPFPTSHLASSVSRALDRRRLVLENRALRQELERRTGLSARLVGQSPAMERLRRETLALAATGADILILGETGAGKEVVARALHDEGPRRSGPFVALNCGALPAEIIESELFGHEQGAFTGASKQRIGKLEHANGGTVFLDEIESMPLALQVKLLRVTEQRAIERLGSNKTIPLDVRFVAATKTDLKKASDEGRFRQDLYFRLNVVTLNLPPLRERKEDIPLLFYHLLSGARVRYGRGMPDVPAGLFPRLAMHDWPGNVRELRNLVDRFVLGLPLGLGEESDPGEDGVADTSTLVGQVEQYERALVVAEIARTGGNVTNAASGLGVSRKTLYEKMRKYGIRRGQDGAPEGQG